MNYLSIHDDYENKAFLISDIGEDLDFGCEERSDQTPVMAVVFLEQKESHEKYMVKVPDAFLTEKNINAGDLVYVTKERYWVLTKKGMEI